MDDLKKQFQKHFPPRLARVHEVYGASDWCFALGMRVRQKDPTLWICKEAYHVPFDLCLGNTQFIFVTDPKTQLWCFEEGLRSGAVSLVVSVHDKAVGFTLMRRLQLAAEAGGTTGLILTAQDRTSPASETRWQCEPLCDPQGRALQTWSLVKNKQGAVGQWKVVWDEKTHRITVV